MLGVSVIVGVHVGEGVKVKVAVGEGVKVFVAVGEGEKVAVGVEVGGAASGRLHAERKTAKTTKRRKKRLFFMKESPTPALHG
jgi:hypothetical protein